MNKALLVMGLACLSVAAVAQSSKSTDQPADTKKAEAPRDAASGQASGKRMHKPLTVQAESTATEQTAGKVTGTMAADDWNTNAKTKTTTSSSSNGQAQTNVAAGDVNGDGKADAKNSGHASEKLDVAAPRDSASGQASGKRQIKPVSATTTSTQDATAGAKPEKK